MTAWNPPLFMGEELKGFQSVIDAGAADVDAALSRGLLVSYGKCLVHDVPVPLPNALTVELAFVGVTELARELSHATVGMDDSVERWRDADSQFESDAIVAGLLDLRMDAWYGAEAVERLAASAEHNAKVRLNEAGKSLEAAADAYSVALENNVDVLSTAVATPLLRNWRAMLPPRLGLFPWWLDGTLEAAALELAQEFDRTIGVFGRRKRTVVMPSARGHEPRRSRDAALRGPTAALAASASHQVVAGIEWTLPGTTLRATLYVPPRLERGDELTLRLEDASGGEAAFDAVGTVAFLNGEPLHWRLTGSAQRPEVAASWLWSGVEQLSHDRTLKLVDGATGAEWVAAREAAGG
jgi:hypothetical protein